MLPLVRRRAIGADRTRYDAPAAATVGVHRGHQVAEGRDAVGVAQAGDELLPHRGAAPVAVEPARPSRAAGGRPTPRRSARRRRDGAGRRRPRRPGRRRPPSVHQRMAPTCSSLLIGRWKKVASLITDPAGIDVLVEPHQGHRGPLGGRLRERHEPHRRRIGHRIGAHQQRGDGPRRRGRPARSRTGRSCRRDRRPPIPSGWSSLNRHRTRHRPPGSGPSRWYQALVPASGTEAGVVGSAGSTTSRTLAAARGPRSGLSPESRLGSEPCPARPPSTTSPCSASTGCRSRRSAWPSCGRWRPGRTARRTTSTRRCGPSSAPSPARRCTTPSASSPRRGSSGASSRPDRRLATRTASATTTTT